MSGPVCLSLSYPKPGEDRPHHRTFASFSVRLRLSYPKPGEGYFECRACKNPLYSAEAKFKSGCGWPAFDKCYKNAVEVTEDNSHGMRRIEITCASCAGHLGHVFVGEHMTPTNERHCVNSVSVKFVKGAAVVDEEEIVTEKLKK